MSLINGVVTGLVTEVNKKAMVKVKFPWLPDEPETEWIRIATTMAGNGRGTFFMPEKDDEVLVAFEHGDFDHPFVIGFLWNGIDKPPNDDINPSIRRMKTVSGHILEFNDNDSKESIRIETQSGHKIELKDSDSAQIEIITTNEQKISLNDDSKTILIETGSQKITMEESGIKIEGTTIELKGESIDIEATSGQLTAKGNPIYLNP